MSEADYVLLITHDRLNISAKFYDYIGAGKPILACVRRRRRASSAPAVARRLVGR